MDISNVNVNDLTELVCHDGIFDSFDDSSLTNSQFTNNSNNIGSSFSQSSSLLQLPAHASLTTQAVKMQNSLVLAPIRAQPWPVYVDFILESRLKFTTNITLAGFAVANAEDDFVSTTNEKFLVGLFYTGSGAGQSGLKIIDPSGVETTYTSELLSQDTYYNLVVRIKYNYQATTNNTDVFVYAWLNGVKIIDGFTINRNYLSGLRLDGKVGLAGILNSASSGAISWDYYCSNRFTSLITYQYRLTTLFKIGDFQADAINVQSEGQMMIGKESVINVYARNTTADSWQRRWDGFIDDVTTKKEGQNLGMNSIITITASHYSKLLDQRNIIKSYTSQTTDYIIKDGSNGIIPLKASDIVTTNNVQSGVYSLSESYNMDKLRHIVLELSAEEDYLPWLDEDHDINFKAVNTLIDTGLSYTVGDGKLLDHKIDEIGPAQYTAIEVYGQGADLNSDSIHLIYKLNSSSYLEGGERNRVLIYPNVTTNDEAIRKAREYLLKSEPILMGTNKVLLDYTNKVGYIITLTLEDEALGIQERQFIIIEIIEKPLELEQIVTIAEANSGIIDLLYENFLQTAQMDNRDGNSSAPVTYAVQIDLVIGIRIDYIVEYSTDGGLSWTEHDSGKAVTTHRAIAIETACIGNEASSNPIDGDFSNGAVCKVGTGTTQPKIDDTDLSSPLSSLAVGPDGISEYQIDGNEIAIIQFVWTNDEMILNGGVESGSGTSADNWTQSGIDRSTFVKHNGSYSFYDSSGTDFVSYIEQTLATSMAVSDIALLTFWAWTAGFCTVRIILTYSDLSTSQQDFSVGSSTFTKFTFTNFTAGKTVTKIKFTNSTLAGYVAIDDISLLKVSSIDNIAITEAGFYIDRQAPSYGSNSVNQYATISKWAPYNVTTQLLCHALFNAITKTSTSIIRITFKILHEFSPQLKKKV